MSSRLPSDTLISTSGGYGLGRASELACKAGQTDDVSTLLPMTIDSMMCGCAALRARFLGAEAAAP